MAAILVILAVVLLVGIIIFTEDNYMKPIKEEEVKYGIPDPKEKLADKKNKQKTVSKTEKENSSYDEKCRKTNTLAFVIPFLIVFIIVLFACGVDEVPVMVPFALFFALGASLIGMIVGHQWNIDYAEENNIPEDNPRLKYEKKEKAIGIVATTIAVASIGKKTKDAVKDVCDVDGWDKRKQK